MSTSTMHPFEPRPIRFLRVVEHAGWRLKLYSIVYDDSSFDEHVFEPGLRLALSALPQPATSPSRPGLGFCILHKGRGADYIVLAWWDRENEMPVRVFVHTQEERQWRSAGPTESFCVWDLQVMAFERDAYVSTILAKQPLEKGEYLNRVLEFEPEH